jgi:hypothetical protein
LATRASNAARADTAQIPAAVEQWRGIGPELWAIVDACPEEFL